MTRAGRRITSGLSVYSCNIVVNALMDVDEPASFGLQIITKVLLLSCISGALAENLNFTYRLEKRLFSKLHPPGLIDTIEPWRALRDISYLPEDDYSQDELEYESGDQKYPEFERDDRNLLPEYRTLCETKTKKVELSDSQYEYQPPHYHEVYCKSYSLLGRIQALARPSQQMCAHPSFHCVQRSKTMFMVRRRWESECWEPYSKQVASGCECMWPVSSLGDISGHY